MTPTQPSQAVEVTDMEVAHALRIVVHADGVWTTTEVTAMREALEQFASQRVPVALPAEPVRLDEFEQYRMQMAGISTAALGYWKEGDSLHPDYDTPTLRDVAKLYAKYEVLFKAASEQGDAKDAVLEALKLAIRQNEHDMLMTGEELRMCHAAILASKATAAGEGK